MQKTKRIKCKKYTDWVKSLPSCVSLRPADDPHHIKNVLFTGTGKTHDFFTLPLTRDEHTDLHHRGARQWEEVNNINQAEAVLTTLNYALNQGLIEINWVGE